MMHQPNQQMSTASTIKCCRHCVAPKRHTACWGHCPEYQKEKAEYEERKAARYGNPEIKAGLDAQRTKVITRLMKGRGKK